MSNRPRRDRRKKSPPREFVKTQQAAYSLNLIAEDLPSGMVVFGLQLREPVVGPFPRALSNAMVNATLMALGDPSVLHAGNLGVDQMSIGLVLAEETVLQVYFEGAIISGTWGGGPYQFVASLGMPESLADLLGIYQDRTRALNQANQDTLILVSPPLQP